MKALKEYEHIYFLGIGGIGMSALARYCLLSGIRISGYDRQSSVVTEGLVNEGAMVHFDDDPEEIDGHPDLVIYTPAISADSRIRAHFKRFQVPIMKRSEALELITQGIDTIAVAGTHGKTTTSSMISYLLQATGIPHTALLGGIAANYRSNFHSDGQSLMVVEADEYDRSFLRLHPKWAVVKEFDQDHSCHESTKMSPECHASSLTADGLNPAKKLKQHPVAEHHPGGKCHGRHDEHQWDERINFDVRVQDDIRPHHSADRSRCANHGDYRGRIHEDLQQCSGQAA